MARLPKPWFRADRQSYYVTIRAVRHDLGPEKDEADRLFHELMAAKPQVALPPAAEITAAELSDRYLDWCKKHREQRTYDFYLEHLQSFLKSLKAESTTIAASGVKPIHFIEWADKQTGWGACRRRGGIGAIQRAFNWGAKVGLIDRSQIAGIEKPTPTRRDQVVPEKHYKKMLGLVRAPIQDLLNFAWEAGARPQEICHFEARHYNAERVRLELPPAEAKGKKRWRIIHLTDKARAIIERRVLRFPEGKLFRNYEGLPWNKSSMNCVFTRLKKKLGVKYALYAFRHTFA
jgi:integrase